MVHCDASQPSITPQHLTKSTKIYYSVHTTKGSARKHCKCLDGVLQCVLIEIGLRIPVAYVVSLQLHIATTRIPERRVTQGLVYSVLIVLWHVIPLIVSKNRLDNLCKVEGLYKLFSFLPS